MVILKLSDHEAMESALIENLQRQDLNPMEEALGYRSLMEEYQMTQEEVAKAIGKSLTRHRQQPAPAGVATAGGGSDREGKLSAGHGRALLALEEESAILEAAQTAVKKHWTVREIEKMAQSSHKKTKVSTGPDKDHYYTELELALSQVLGRQVTITSKGKNRTLSIAFFDKEDSVRVGLPPVRRSGSAVAGGDCNGIF